MKTFTVHTTAPYFDELYSHQIVFMKTIGLFCGGYSSEFDISMKSADTIIQHFPETYTILKIEVTTKGWFVHLNDKRIEFSAETFSFKNESQKEIKIDTALIYIHGNPGENGKLQAYFDMKGLPYINSGALASELSFDKWYCNQFLRNFGIPVANSIFMRKSDTLNPQEIVAQLGLPCFVKPSDSGSSYGISKVNTIEALQPAIDKAFQEGNTLVIESLLTGTEVTCGLYESTGGIIVLPITEIVTENDFFDFEAKYLGQSKEITPARISEEETKWVQETAKKCYQLLQLRSVARIDFMIQNGTPYVIEVNTTPGFSPASIVPQMLAVAGTSITQFWSDILTVELNR